MTLECNAAEGADVVIYARMDGQMLTKHVGIVEVRFAIVADVSVATVAAVLRYVTVKCVHTAGTTLPPAVGTVQAVWLFGRRREVCLSAHPMRSDHALDDHIRDGRFHVVSAGEMELELLGIIT